MEKETKKGRKKKKKFVKDICDIEGWGGGCERMTFLWRRTV